MGGLKLPDDAIVSTYIGQADGGLLRVLARPSRPSTGCA
jgi:hypothetical protein